MMDEIDDATQELFYGEWKNDKRNGQVWVSGQNLEVKLGLRHQTNISAPLTTRGTNRIDPSDPDHFYSA